MKTDIDEVFDKTVKKTMHQDTVAKDASDVLKNFKE